MTIQQAVVWLQFGQQLVAAGIATVDTIRTWIRNQHAGLSDGDLNAILDGIVAGATLHRQLANADAGVKG